MNLARPLPARRPEARSRAFRLARNGTLKMRSNPRSPLSSAFHLETQNPTNPPDPGPPGTGTLTFVNLFQAVISLYQEEAGPPGPY